MLTGMSMPHRFEDIPNVGEDGIRFFAGAPLISCNGYQLGTLCASRPLA